MPKNVEDLGKLIFAKDFKKLPKVQQIAQSGHTAQRQGLHKELFIEGGKDSYQTMSSEYFFFIFLEPMS